MDDMAPTKTRTVTVPTQRTATPPTRRRAPQTVTWRFTLATRLALGVAGLTEDHHRALDGLTVTVDLTHEPTPGRRARATTAALLDALREVHTPLGGWSIDASGYADGDRRAIGRWVRDDTMGLIEATR